MIEFDCRTGLTFSWKVSVQDESERGTKRSFSVQRGSRRAREKPAQAATTRLPPPRDPHLDPAIQPPNCQHDFPPSMWNTISWPHDQAALAWPCDHFTVSFWSFDHVKHIGFHLITWLYETPLLPLVRILFTSEPYMATWEYLLTDLSLFVIDFMNC